MPRALVEPRLPHMTRRRCNTRFACDPARDRQTAGRVTGYLDGPLDGGQIAGARGARRGQDDRRLTVSCIAQPVCFRGGHDLIVLPSIPNSPVSQAGRGARNAVFESMPQDREVNHAKAMAGVIGIRAAFRLESKTCNPETAGRNTSGRGQTAAMWGAAPVARVTRRAQPLRPFLARSGGFQMDRKTPIRKKFCLGAIPG